MTANSNHLHALAVERDLDAVLVFADAVIERAGLDRTLPLLGSPEWVAASDEVRLASLARWVGVTVMETDPAVVATRVAAELLANRRAHLAARKQAALTISEGHDWRAVAQRKRSGWSR